MKLAHKNYIKKYHKSIVYFTTGAAFLLVFIIGLGRYRTILFYAIFSVLKGGFSARRLDAKILYYLFLPILLVTFYLDVKNGQILPIFPNLHFIITLFTLLLVEIIVTEFTKKILEKLSDTEIFRVCPQCGYDNKNLVDQCVTCSYKKVLVVNDPQHNSADCSIAIDKDILIESEKYKKSGLLKRPSRKLLNVLNLDQNEIILINLKISPFKSFLKNGIRDMADNFVLTNKRFFFIAFFPFSCGWRMKEVLLFNEITDVIVTKKREYTKKEPLVIIKTDYNSYELFFRSLFPYRKQINGIVDCIKRRNPNVNVNIDLA